MDTKMRNTQIYFNLHVVLFEANASKFGKLIKNIAHQCIYIKGLYVFILSPGRYVDV